CSILTTSSHTSITISTSAANSSWNASTAATATTARHK
ncbi:hypothetical protein D021_1599B, partial [Vibrio parahaemolyticus 10296]